MTVAPQRNLFSLNFNAGPIPGRCVAQGSRPKGNSTNDGRNITTEGEQGQMMDETSRSI